MLVSIRYAPINPADLYSALTGGGPGEETPAARPFVAGSDCAAVVAKVGPGVKALAEDDWVIPIKPGMGTFRTLAVWKEKDLMKLPTDLMPMEHVAMMRQLCVGYRCVVREKKKKRNIQQFCLYLSDRSARPTRTASRSTT